MKLTLSSLVVVLLATIVQGQFIAENFFYKTFDTTIGLSKLNGVKVNGKFLISGSDQLRTGAVWFNRPLHLAQRKWSTTFTFTINSPGDTGADGFALVMQTANSAQIGEDAASIGYGGIKNGIALEFDTFYNELNHDPVSGKQHICFHPPQGPLNTILADDNGRLGNWRYESPNGFNDGSRHTVVVEHDHDGTNWGFTVTLDTIKITPTPIVFNLESITGFAGGFFMGFTAATGGSTEEHLLNSWGYRQLSGAGASSCAPGFTDPSSSGSACSPNTAGGVKICEELGDCHGCTTSDYPCTWDDGCSFRGGGMIDSLECPNSQSLVWVWILLSIAIVILGTVATLWYFKRRAAQDAIDSTGYGYL